MSKTKDYIDNLMEQGIDVFADENRDYDYEYQKFLEDSYRESLDKMNKHFMENTEEISKSE